MINVRGHRILVRPPKVKESCIELPEEYYDRERLKVGTGEVVQKGSTCYQHESMGLSPWCEVGDTIMFAAHGGRQVTDPDTEEKFWVINDEDVFAVIVGDNSE